MRERSLSVCQKGTFPTTPFVPHGIPPERQTRLFNFTENLERKDLNVLEEALVLSSC